MEDVVRAFLGMFTFGYLIPLGIVTLFFEKEDRNKEPDPLRRNGSRYDW